MINKKLSIDYLANHPDYKVVQHEDMYHFNTDTCLLGEFIHINSGEKVLDVGTNNGALLIYIIKKGGQATGIEINKDALEICKLTLKENNIKANLICDDFSIYDSNHYYDVIVSNPPYFTSLNDNEKNNNPNKSMARHESHLNLDNLCISLSKNLKETGRIYLIYRAFRFLEIKEKFEKNKLFINKCQFIFDRHKLNEAKSVLLEISFSKHFEKLNDMVIN